ncbi:hypothetical protein ABZP36_006246 [Zizania latifolia]
MRLESSLRPRLSLPPPLTLPPRRRSCGGEGADPFSHREVEEELEACEASSARAHLQAARLLLGVRTSALLPLLVLGFTSSFLLICDFNWLLLVSCFLFLVVAASLEEIVMLAKSPAPPFLTATETAAINLSTTCDLLSSPSAGLSKKKYGARLSIQPNIDFGKTQNCRTQRKWRTLSADQGQATVVDAGERKTWDEAKQILASLDFSIEDADKMLKKAFGWIHSPYWSEERKKEVPNVEVVSGVLNYIRSLGLSDDDLRKLLKKFPEVLGCDLDSEVKLNVSKLDSDWGINGKTLRSLLLRNPKVLGYNVDCRGDCMAQCTRCWVRF